MRQRKDEEPSKRKERKLEEEVRRLEEVRPRKRRTFEFCTNGMG